MDVFRKLYEDRTRELSDATGLPTLTKNVERDFVSLALDLLATRADVKKAHCVRLQGSRSMRGLDFNGCSFCLLKLPCHVLDCKHQLCFGCTDNHAPLRSCPVCQQPNSKIPQRRLLTAGIRELQVHGHDAEDILNFLGNLQRSTGLNSSSLRCHFDSISGSGLGKFPP